MEKAVIEGAITDQFATENVTEQRSNEISNQSGSNSLYSSKRKRIKIKKEK
ncbi:hypothetical protein CASFOL_041695 [Castilleja foliolosa]|uniref:Uncharacterized protein n=1 Tax=Castilleja foliolosa TaxID=1961234 RepID=A0ABD3BBH7_9LAMI